MADMDHLSRVVMNLSERRQWAWFGKPAGWFLGLVVLAIALAAVGIASAREAAQGDPPPNPSAVLMGNRECLDCHAQPGMVLPFSDDDALYLTIDPILFGASSHGRRGYACVQCHLDISGYPHPQASAGTSRELRVSMVGVCQNCHAGAQEQYAGGRHAESVAGGNLEAAICSDCHNPHALNELGASRTKIAKTCEGCHSQIFDVYKESVHGDALLNDFNADVPSCIDCHDYHGTRGPTDPSFHLFSPDICARCHADESLMAKYGVNTQVFDTYISDFHGTTVSIFERIAPDQQTNKPVCVDCHGVHDIRKPTDENSNVIKQNLLGTCQRCHVDATPNFSDAWLGHYPPDLEHYAVVYLVDLFYKLFIPGTLTGMGFFIVTDILRQRREGRGQGKNHA
ncbi:MAG: cytochrome c3 family protein [Chloroflexi bacterium]|nr:cytochrome c3 family protein [Chloroflexota bacterium]